MKQFLAPAEIVNDLLAENWTLRRRVFEHLHQSQLYLRNFSRSSREYKKAIELCREMANRLNGPSDINLHLVLCAAWFLGRSHFLLLTLENIGVADPEPGDPESNRLKKPLINNHPEASFHDYFLSLLSRGKAVDAATATAIRLFPPAISLKLISSIPEAEARRSGLRQLQLAHPGFQSPNLLEDNSEDCRRLPELLDFIGPGLSPEARADLDDILEDLFQRRPENDLVYAVRAVARLKLSHYATALQQCLSLCPEAAMALARLGDPQGCARIMKTASSWLAGRRRGALAALASCPQDEALAILSKSLERGKTEEQREALQALSERRDAKSLDVIIEHLEKTRKPAAGKLFLQALSGKPWPGATDNAAASLARLAEKAELYPELLQALGALSYTEPWGDILQRINSPVINPLHREIALFMTRHASRPEIRRRLLKLLSDIDWPFSYRLLKLLEPHFRLGDIPILINLLKDRLERRTLNISERLSKGRDLEKFSEALSEFLGLHPEVGQHLLKRLAGQMISGGLSGPERLFAGLRAEPDQLAEIILSRAEFDGSCAEEEYPLLLLVNELAQIEVDGSDCFALVVHRTRRYSGFFRRRISGILHQLLDNASGSGDLSLLPVLHEIVDFLRGQPHFDELRQLVLKEISRITRHCRELKVFNEASQTRELKVLKVRKLK